MRIGETAEEEENVQRPTSNVQRSIAEADRLAPIRAVDDVSGLWELSGVFLLI